MNFSEKLAARDGELVNNWYVAGLSEELKNKPLEKTIYDRSLVLFRGPNGKAACLPNRCLHRNVLLSEGQVENGNLRCPYHGWLYNSQGKVIEVPSEGVHSQSRAKACTPNLECIEKEGVIWVWMGTHEALKKQPTPPWSFPNYESAGWTHYFMVTDFDNEVTHLVENFMDVAHTVFVHKGWFRDPERIEVPTDICITQGKVTVTYLNQDDQFSWFARYLLNPRGEAMTHTDQFIYPNLTRVDYTFGSNSGLIINSQCTPISTLKSRVYTYIAYKMPFMGPLLKPVVQFYTRKVIEQDVVIMKNQGRSFKMHDDLNFHSTPADEVHRAIEKLRDTGVQKQSKVHHIDYKKQMSFWI